MKLPRNMKTKAAGVALRMDGKGNVTSDGSFLVGYASTFGGPVDAQGDVVRRGAYAASLQVRPSVPVLRMHDTGRPIGKTMLLVENDVGLAFKARISDTSDGEEMLTLIGDQVVTQMSIGYTAEKTSYGPHEGEARARFLEVVDLYEISPVTFAANPSATVGLSSSGKAALLDAVTIAEYEQKRAHGWSVGQAEFARYKAAFLRQLERRQFEGKTAREVRYDLLFKIQEIETA